MELSRLQSPGISVPLSQTWADLEKGTMVFSGHQLLGIGGICVEIERQRVTSEERTGDGDRIFDDDDSSPVILRDLSSAASAETLRTGGQIRLMIAR